MLKLRKKIPLFVLLTSLLIACEATPSSQDHTNGSTQKVTLRTAHSSWIEEHFQTEIVRIGLEKLGYEVETPKEIEYPALYISLANGDLDYSVVYYYPGHEEFFENAGGKAKLEGVGTITPDGIQGYQIDRKTAQEHNITNLEQLKDPKIAKLFDSDGDGKANLVGCNPGWACESVIEHHLDAYGLRETVEHDQGQYIALLANSLTRYQEGQSIIFYAYNPHWIGATLKPEEDVVWLEVPFTDLPPKIAENMKGEDTLVNGQNLGFPKTKQRIAANKQFLADNPMAKRWLELVQVPAKNINEESLRIKEGENKPEDIRRHAEEWVENHQELFNSWLDKARNE